MDNKGRLFSRWQISKSKMQRNMKQWGWESGQYPIIRDWQHSPSSPKLEVAIHRLVHIRGNGTVRGMVKERPSATQRIETINRKGERVTDDRASAKNLHQAFSADGSQFSKSAVWIMLPETNACVGKVFQTEANATQWRFRVFRVNHRRSRRFYTSRG